MSELPFVTLAMPSYNEELYIEACLRSLLDQTYPADRMEILVADGGGPDKTREIVGRIAAADPRVRLLDNSKHKIQSHGMNLAIKEARGEFILVTDVHAEYRNDYIEQLVNAFLRTGADCAGGAQRAKAETPFQKALCAALSSPLGVGGAPYRSAEAEGWVDTVFPGSFRRSILEKVGLYDTEAVTNEDAELQQRILEAGGRVYLSKDVVVHYYPRKSFKLLGRQYRKYGDGRARTLLLHGRFPVMRPLIPGAGLAGLAAMVLAPPLWPLLPVAVGGYLAATGVEAVRVTLKAGESPTLIPTVWAIFPTLHFTHGFGMLAGLIKYKLTPKPPVIERLEPRAQPAAQPAPTSRAPQASLPS